MREKRTKPRPPRNGKPGRPLPAMMEVDPAERDRLRALLRQDGAWDAYDRAMECELRDLDTHTYAGQRAALNTILVLVEARRALLEKAGLGPDAWRTGRPPEDDE